jgi:hypothetical protein
VLTPLAGPRQSIMVADEVVAKDRRLLSKCWLTTSQLGVLATYSMESRTNLGERRQPPQSCCGELPSGPICALSRKNRSISINQNQYA